MKILNFILILSLFFVSACSIFDYPARFAGFSIQKFEGKDAIHIEKTIQMSKKECFDKTLQIIDKMYARITHKSYKKGYVVAFDFSKTFDYCLDSTEAAFFIEELNAAEVKVTVSCNNSALANNLAVKYFEQLTQTETEK